MEIELKWKKYKKEKIENSFIWKVSKLLNFIAFLVFLKMVLFIFFRFEIMVIPFSFLLVIVFLSCYFIQVILEEREKNVKEAFFKEHKKEILISRVTKIVELTAIQQENQEDKFLISTVNFRGQRRQDYFSSTTRIMFDSQQILDFAVKTKKGTQLKTYVKERNCQVYIKELTNEADEYPRLEVKAGVFASENLQKEFAFLSCDSVFWTEYTFFVPKGSVKIIAGRGAVVD